jgi:outer membrane protein TolC
MSGQTNSNQLTQLIDEAIEVSPRIKMLQNKKFAAEERVPQASNLPDPMLTLGMMNLPTNSFSLTQEPMTGKVVGLSQKVPFPGKLGAAGKVKEMDSEIIQQEIEDEINQIKNDVSENYYNLVYVREAIDLTKESQKLLKNIKNVVQTKYTVSKASQQNIIQVETEITRLKDKLKSLENKKRTFVSNLNALLLKDSDSPIETDSLTEIPDHNLTVDTLVSLASVHRPFLKGIKLEEQKAKKMQDLAEYEFYPNFNFSVQYSQRDEIARTNTDLHDFASFMVGLSLPINYGGKKTAKVQEAELMGKMYDNHYQSAKQMLRRKFGSSVSKLQELREREELIETGLLPQAQQSYNSAMASYRVGEIDFINVIDTQTKLLQVKTNLYKVRSEYQKVISKLEFLTGTELNKE